MLPIQKRHSAARAAAIGLCALSLWNCGESGDEPSKVSFSESEMARVALTVAHTEAPLVDSLVVDCIGADTLHIKKSPKETDFDLDLFPSDHWVFRAKLYANGALMQSGEIEVKIEAGTTVALSIPMHAIAGFVYAEIPLGFGNPAGVASGTLEISSEDDDYVFPMSVDGSNAIFKSDMLPLGKNYGIRISLKDSTGVDIYSAEDSFFLDESSPVPELSISSLRAKLNISIQMASEVQIDLPLTLPASKRNPRVGDVVISEFLVNPSKGDSDMFDYIEIYNGSNDTLTLANCSIGKTTNPKESAAIEAIALPPRELLVLGNDTNPNTPTEHRHTELMPTFTKSNQSTAASIVLACGDMVMDSVYYGKTDSLHLSAVPLNSNTNVSKSTQLNIGAWDDRENPENWCVGTPTPNSLSFCD